MTIDEAIKILRIIYADIDVGQADDDLDAIQLGIEALKRVKVDRTLPYPVISDPLPGETEE